MGVWRGEAVKEELMGKNDLFFVVLLHQAALRQSLWCLVGVCVSVCAHML